jgi:hypothetical protein
MQSLASLQAATRPIPLVRRLGNTVEIASDSHMIDSCDLHCVIDVTRHIHTVATTFVRFPSSLWASSAAYSSGALPVSGGASGSVSVADRNASAAFGSVQRNIDETPLATKT